jgi:hypothetical protein
LIAMADRRGIVKRKTYPFTALRTQTGDEDR